jgi:hypothetical protein
MWTTDELFTDVSNKAFGNSCRTATAFNSSKFNPNANFNSSTVQAAESATGLQRMHVHKTKFELLIEAHSWQPQVAPYETGTSAADDAL